MIEDSFGKHHLRYTAPALIEFTVRGPISEQDAVGITGFITEHTRTQPDVLVLVDVTEMGSMSPGARKLAAVSAEQVAYRVLAFHGASFQTRLLVTLTIGAMRLLSDSNHEVRFFKSPTEARTWIEARHHALYAAVPTRRSGTF
ncbi:STAS/SEC14 domain-containing protein [Chondromyces crocatus]|uniref:STAS/SEC14 domain-containing protein n=1 Tax=Chondromyces crocatus TaxID=52 RepID=A0A0K1EBK2_CHOCO|nr:STAS/SEC14 domain-containing protein [Chondromyces crocatus]AKT37958.1 uncharacterized protein CMC5_020990 [Chondromyces crocatus]